MRGAGAGMGTKARQNTDEIVTGTSRGVESREEMMSEGGSGGSATVNGTVHKTGSGREGETVATTGETKERTTKDPRDARLAPPLVPLRLLVVVLARAPSRHPLLLSRTKPNPTSTARVSLQQRPTPSSSPMARTPCLNTMNPPRLASPCSGGGCMYSRGKTSSVRKQLSRATGQELIVVFSAFRSIAYKPAERISHWQGSDGYGYPHRASIMLEAARGHTT